ncbi:cytochrome P450 [Dendrothele bispora CBS 962.96]|uniref:Cytochrome P450 n=1 Tax=Dendrothele bispora (strain CBS 962.96) TaxID=1314807 RepID=A0A4S8MCB3_DENBC|nr:cytochrome P450 [Dendrothele bispora CBS 962.96]
MPTLNFLDYALLCWGLYLIFRLFLRHRKFFPLPPGPRGHPLIGNLLDIPSSYEWLAWTKMGEKWGDLISLSTFGNTIIIINSHSLAVKMLNEKNDIYSDRPYVPMLNDVCKVGDIMGCLPNGRRLKAYRKLFQNGLGTSAGIRTFYPQEEELAKIFIMRLVNSPENLVDHCFHHSGAIILRIVYGYDVQESNDPMIDISTQAMEDLSKASAQGRFLVNYIPFLLKGGKKTGKEWAKSMAAMQEVPFHFVEKQLMNGQAKDCFVTRWLAKDLSPEEEKYLRHASGSMFGVQKLLQKEIDDAVGQGRLPSFSDKEKLPFLEATLKEVKRFHTIVPTGIAHCTSMDDIHDRMFIPKGAIVIPNIWRMAHDPDVYKDPTTFDPTRFLGERREQDPNEYIFGFGRRICPGRLLADASIYIAIAMILFAFDISPGGPENKPPVYEILPTGTISHVQPFECKITPRKEIHKLKALLK